MGPGNIAIYLKPLVEVNQVEEEEEREENVLQLG